MRNVVLLRHATHRRAEHQVSAASRSMSACATSGDTHSAVSCSRSRASPRTVAEEVSSWRHFTATSIRRATARRRCEPVAQTTSTWMWSR